MGWLGGYDSLGLTLSSEECVFQTLTAKEVTLPLLGPSGAALKALVNPGDQVKEGALLAQDGEERLLSPFEGEIVGVVSVPHPVGRCAVQALRMTVQGATTPEKAIEPLPEPEKVEAGALWDALSQAALPSFVPGVALADLLPKEGRNAPERLVIHAADQDLNLLVRAQLLRDSEATLAKAVSLIKEITHAPKALVAVLDQEAKKAGELLRYLKVEAEVFAVKDAYPASHSRLVAYQAGTGTLVLPLALVLAIYDALALGKLPAFCPLTVVDQQGRQQNLRVPVGMSVRAVLEALNLSLQDGERLIFGGAMAGAGQYNLNTPVLFGVEGITLLPADPDGLRPSQSCINCGDCINVCPVGLQPHLMGRQCEFGLYDDVQNLDACILCGLCSYVCPANRPMKQWFELAQRITTDET